jgi:hypothetical protein
MLGGTIICTEGSVHDENAGGNADFIAETRRMPAATMQRCPIHMNHPMSGI